MTDSRRLLAHWVLTALLGGAPGTSRRNDGVVPIERPLSPHEVGRLRRRARVIEPTGWPSSSAP